MKSFIKKLIVTAICAIGISLLLTIGVSADTGPKASVTVAFQNTGGKLCYATLLSQSDSVGPNHAWNGKESDIINRNLDIDIWRAFAEYKDPDGFFFLQSAWKISDTEKLEWTYMPPDRFKILIYYPDTGTFISSGIYEQYAFHSYYTVDMNSAEITAIPSYDYMFEASSLALRMIITLAIELGFAIFFDIKEKKPLLLLLGANIGTQILLNVLLNVTVGLYSGAISLLAVYALFELIVFAAEAALYCAFMNKLSENRRTYKFYILYAFIANAASLLAGMFIIEFLPAI